MSSDAEIGCRRHVLTVIKVATFFLCLAGFIANSYAIFIQFIGKKTISSQNVESNAELLLPSFTICSLSGFKEEIDELEDLELENYLKKTLDLGEIFVGVYEFPIDGRRSIIDSEAIKVNATTWKLTTTYSKYKGRCHTLTYQKLVKSLKNHIFLLMY